MLPPSIQPTEVHHQENPTILRYPAVPTNQRSTASGTSAKPLFMRPDTLPTRPYSFLKTGLGADRVSPSGKNTEVALRIQPLLTKHPPHPAELAHRQPAQAGRHASRNNTPPEQLVSFYHTLSNRPSDNPDPTIME